jgi:NAD(P)-dependent dehydrogenase (short-subunit alcohol dehydrogenase family)
MQTAIVTGVSRGLGEAIAAQLLARDWAVVGVGRASGARLASDRYRFVALDLAKVETIEAQLTEPFESVARMRPSAVACINNAATAGPVGIAGRIPALEIGASLAVNLIAPVAIANLFCRIFIDSGQDRRIVNVSSGAAHRPLPGSALYCAAKAGLEMFSRTLAAEQGPDGIRVVSLRPGIIDTEMQAFMRAQSEHAVPSVPMFREFHAQRQLVAPDVAAAKIVEKIVLEEVEQGRTYSYAEL